MKRLVGLTLVVGCLVAAGLSSAATTPFGGIFETTIKGSPQLDGKWLLSFAPNGAYAVAREPSTKVLIGGSSTVSAHTIVFVDKTGPLACKGKQARGTYSWSLSGKTLRLEAVKDTCIGRPAVLSSEPFVKVG